MGKFEGVIKAEIVRLAKREVRKITVPLGRDLRSLKNRVSQIRRALLSLERLAAEQQKELGKGREALEASPEEVKGSRFSPRLIRALRKRLRVTQKEMAILAGVTVGAIYQWEKGLFEPRGKKKAVLVALRKLGRRDVKKLLEGKKAERAGKKVSRGTRAKSKKVRRRRTRGRRVRRK